MKVTPANIHKLAAENMPPEHIAHWYSDLYIKKTPFSERLIRNYEYRRFVTVFCDQITGAPWYEIPFCYDRNLEAAHNV